MGKAVFISHRRADNPALALSVAQYLEKIFGARNVFIDIDRIHPGAHFPSVLETYLEKCDAVFVIIGLQWFGVRVGQNTRRIDEPGDWVRLEVERALQRQIAVVPILVDGASLPKKSDLPTSLAALADLQAVTIDTATFRRDMAGLVRDLPIYRDLSKRRFRTRSAAISSIFAAAALCYMAVFTDQWTYVAGTYRTIKVGNKIGSLPDLIERGNLAMSTGSTQEAERLFTAARDRFPQSEAPYVGLAELALLNNNPRTAARFAESARTKGPSNFKAHALFISSLIVEGSEAARLEAALAEPVKSNPKMLHWMSCLKARGLHDAPGITYPEIARACPIVAD